MKRPKSAGKRVAKRGVSFFLPETVVYARRSMTLPPELEKALDETVEPGAFSAFAQRALWHELQRERIGRWLDEREIARGGPPSPEAIEFAERAWKARK